jgi:hypothetical protein
MPIVQGGCMGLTPHKAGSESGYDNALIAEVGWRTKVELRTTHRWGSHVELGGDGTCPRSS